jgi:outer membrane protein assembly factor BamB
VTCTPAIVAGVVYWTDWEGGVHASRARDGSEVWSQTFPVGFSASPWVAETVVYIGDRKSTLYALDRADGHVVWSRSVDAWPRTHLYGSPIVVDGIIVLGISSDGTQADRRALPPDVVNQFYGSVVGLSESDGRELWRFETSTQSSDGPGVSVWSSAAIDRKRKAAFIGTGNGYAAPVSPYSDALLALRYETGELAWYRQFTANDAFTTGTAAAGPDSDVGAAPNLFTIDEGGTRRDVIGVGDKTGTYRALDPDSGETIWETPLAPVAFDTKTGGVITTAALANGKIFVASNTGYGSSKVWALDTATGGVLWSSEDMIGVTFGAPAVANGVVFAGGSGLDIVQSALASTGVGPPSDFYAIDADTGLTLFRATLPAGRAGGFAVQDGRVYVGSGFSFFGEEPPVGAFQAYVP